MKHVLLIATAIVLIVIAFPAQTDGAPLNQDKPHGNDFMDRPAPPVSDEAKRAMEVKLTEARTRYEANPNDADALIWFGRRLAYPGRFREAIEIYTTGIRKFPNDARFYRHRGHRYLTLRRFDLAIADFAKAAELIKGKPDEVEPDGQPNARNIPTSTLQFNIWYHLGLAYYLTDNYQKARHSYLECLKVSNNPDAIVATTHWLYMTLRRLKRPDDAAKLLEKIGPGMDIIENDGYYRLLLMYKRLVTAEALLEAASKQGNSAASHSVLYGVGNWHLYNGRYGEGVKILRRMVPGDQWTSFGYIAAEKDLKNYDCR